MINSWVLGSCQVRQGSSGSKLRPGGAPGDEGRRGENNEGNPFPGWVAVSPAPARGVEASPAGTPGISPGEIARCVHPLSPHWD